MFLAVRKKSSFTIKHLGSLPNFGQRIGQLAHRLFLAHMRSLLAFGLPKRLRLQPIGPSIALELANDHGYRDGGNQRDEIEAQ
ncbi:hypothetical protein D9M68_996190 [compost metagenome]